MALLRRILCNLSVALIAVLAVMFISTVSRACDAQPFSAPIVGMALASDGYIGSDRPDAHCQDSCRVLCHGLVAIAPELVQPAAVGPVRYHAHLARTAHSDIELDDPPPRA